MSTQLALDALPEWRTRDGVWPIEAHQRGWVRLPYDTAGGGKVGDIVPAWVCCHCGGVELGAYTVELNHGCCVLWAGCRPLQQGTEWRAFDAHWTPERPP